MYLFLFDFCRFFVDNIPIRIFKKNTKSGAHFPTKAMWVEGSLWYSTSVDWAGTVDWAKAPFTVSYQDFNISGCPTGSNNCLLSPSLSPWTRPKLSLHKLKIMKNFRQKNMVYNYCWHKKIAPRFPECSPHHENYFIY